MKAGLVRKTEKTNTEIHRDQLQKFNDKMRVGDVGRQTRDTLTCCTISAGVELQHDDPLVSLLNNILHTMLYSNNNINAAEAHLGRPVHNEL